MLGFDRITFDPNIMGGKACVRGMRVTVALILNLVANGMTTEEVIRAYLYLETEDIQQAVQFAQEVKKDEKESDISGVNPDRALERGKWM